MGWTGLHDSPAHVLAFFKVWLVRVCLIITTLSEVIFEDRKLALQRKQKENKRILPFVTQYQPSVPNLKQILMKNWHLTYEPNFEKG